MDAFDIQPCLGLTALTWPIRSPSIDIYAPGLSHKFIYTYTCKYIHTYHTYTSVCVCVLYIYVCVCVCVFSLSYPLHSFICILSIFYNISSIK